MGKTRNSVVVIDLKHPFQFGDEEITRLKLRRPKLKHFKDIALDNLTGDSIIGLIGKLSDLPPSAAGEIDVEDLEEVGKAIEGFMPRSLKTGGKTSPK